MADPVRRQRVRAVLAVRSDRLAARVRQAMIAVNRGVWLGLLDDAGLDEAAAVAYSSWGRYLSDEHNLSGLFAWEQHAIDTHFHDRKRLLVPAAGAGREVIALATRGHDVVGLDPSADLVEAGRRLLAGRALAVELLHTKPSHIPSFDAPFDGAVIGWGGYTHIQGAQRRVGFLREVRGVLPAGAPVLLSFFLRTPDSRSHQLTLDIARALQRVRRSEMVSELGDAVDGTFDHHFTWSEVRAELCDAGLRPVLEESSPYAHVVAVSE
jgi:hypothetical protein